MTLLEVLGLVFIAVLVLNLIVWFLALKYSTFLYKNFKFKISDEKIEL